MSNRVVSEGWYRANRSTLEGSELPLEVFIGNLFMADLTGIAGKSFYSTKQFHFVGSFTSLPLPLLLSLTHTHSHMMHTHRASSYYKDVIQNYFTLLRSVSFKSEWVNL